jgi:hypothetical protein
MYASRLHMRLDAIRRNITTMLLLITLVLTMAAVYLFVGTVVSAGQEFVNDVRYGRPRTTHLSGFVGHNEASGQQSHFIGLNLNRQVVVLQLPGGDAEQIRMLPGPYLFGAGEDLTPVNLGLEDMDGDGYVDLLVTVRNEQVVYLNKDGAFRLPTNAEQLQIVQQHDS